MASAQLLEHPTDAQVEELVQLLTRAYSGIPLVEMQTDSKREIQEAWHRLGVRIGALEGRIWVVFEPSSEPRGNDSPAIVSTVVAFGPGTIPMGSEAQRNLGLAEFESSLSPETRRWKKEVLQPPCAKLVNESLGQNKPLESWLPILVATDPDHQGRGYATLLMRELLKTAKSDHADSVLFTFSDELETFYGRLGYETKGRVEITSPLGSWVHRAMLWTHEGEFPGQG